MRSAAVKFQTVPWAPGLELEQLGRIGYVALRSTAVVWQLGIRKGFERETVKEKLELDLLTGKIHGDLNRTAIARALELGMLDVECSYLAAEFHT